jgi:hypothetical protein
MTVLKGWNAKIYADFTQGSTLSASAVQIGYADSASVDLAENLDAFFQLGSRQAVDIVEGNLEITGSFEKAWIDSRYLDLLGSPTAPAGALSQFVLCFTIGSGTTPVSTVYAYGCKFDKGSLDIPQDGILKESYDFKAMSISVLPYPAV